jgi:hypothetical protein
VPASACVWITDGSLPVFSDTRVLEARHPALPGIKTRYEGIVDPAVSRGSLDVTAERPDDVLLVEAEWYVEPAEGSERFLADPEALTNETPVVVQGLIEGKWMNRLLGTRAWGPASLGNNVLAAGAGIATTVGALDGEARGEARVEYRTAAGTTQAYVARLEELRGHNVGGLLVEAFRACARSGDRIDGVDLGAVGETAATVNERRRLLGSLVGVPGPHRAKERLVRRAITDALGVPPGETVRLVARDGAGVVLGEATLAWRRAAAASTS